MKASTHGRVSHTNLPKGKPLLPMFEAAVNAHQAIEEAGEGNHSIRIVAERQGNIDDNKPGPIEAFTVTDTGIGFTAPNFESFNTVDSLYKAHLGGKALGRFLWLKAFQRVEIDSHYREDGALWHRRFDFVELMTRLSRSRWPRNTLHPSRWSACLAIVSPISTNAHGAWKPSRNAPSATSCRSFSTRKDRRLR
jgi:hypothetical protein